MSMIKLKVECRICNGIGCYRVHEYGSAAPSQEVPCWTCKGKGWVNSEMRSPDPKWAKRFARKGAEL